MHYTGGDIRNLSIFFAIYRNFSHFSTNFLKNFRFGLKKIDICKIYGGKYIVSQNMVSFKKILFSRFPEDMRNNVHVIYEK